METLWFYLIASCVSFLCNFQTGVNCPKAMSLPSDDNKSAKFKYVNSVIFNRKYFKTRYYFKFTIN